MKLLLQSPLVKTSDPEVFKQSSALLEKEIKLVKRPDTEVVREHIEHKISCLEHHAYPGLRYLNNFEILKSMIHAEERV
jgi:hypothetical protein